MNVGGSLSPSLHHQPVNCRFLQDVFRGVLAAVSPFLVASLYCPSQVCLLSMFCLPRLSPAFEL